MWVRSLGWEDPLEEEMATHSSTLAWRIPWTEDPSGLQSMRLQRGRHNLATKQLCTCADTTERLHFRLLLATFNTDF